MVDKGRKRKRSEDVAPQASEAVFEPPPSARKAEELELMKPNTSKEFRKTLDKYTRQGPSPARQRMMFKARTREGTHKVKRIVKATQEASLRSARAEILLPSTAGTLKAEGMERTYKFKQAQLAENADVASKRKVFELHLDTFGPYGLDYTRNGRFMLLGGRKGHVAMVDMARRRVATELHLKETVRDVHFLHNETMFAVAQKRDVFIYDQNGLEIHSLKHTHDIRRLAFLPYHFLLASVGDGGVLQYQDTSTGQVVASRRTLLGPCQVMTPNHRTAVVCLGHTRGFVTMWTPNVGKAQVKMMCHRGPMQSIAFDQACNMMVTAGHDNMVKVWDVRTFKELLSYNCPRTPTSIAVSQLGMLAVGYGGHIQIWKDALQQRAKSPYLTHFLPSSAVNELAFMPFDDVLGCGHTLGYSNLLVPGAGEPNFDSFEADPFQTKKQRTEREVHSLLDKLQPEMITMDDTVVGSLMTNGDRSMISRKLAENKARTEMEKPVVLKNKTRGRNKPMARENRKQKFGEIKKMRGIEQLADAKKEFPDSPAAAAVAAASAKAESERQQRTAPVIGVLSRFVKVKKV